MSRPAREPPAAPLARLGRQLASFGSVGLLAAVGHYGTLVAAVELLAVPAVPAALAGFLVGGVISYALNRRWTFASRRPHEAAVPRFAVVALAGFALTWLAMAALTRGFGLHYVLAQLLTTGLVMLWTFLANRSWTFAGQPS